MTKIEWVRNPDNITQGITVNSKTGCVNGCPYCYARKLAHGRLKQRYLHGGEFSTSISYHDRYPGCVLDPFYPRWWQERLDKIRASQKPTGIFLDDMSDWMWEGWPEEWTQMELQVMRDCPQHRFYTLTKQPQNLIKWSPFPENCWVGVTATNAKMADDAGYYFQKIDASVRFLSLEPLLEPMQLFFSPLVFNRLDWLIIGACTGRKAEMTELVRRYPELTLMPYGKLWTAQPPIACLREIVEAADKAGVKVFLKDNLKPLIQGAGYSQANWAAKEWVQCEYPILRQEIPTVK